MTEFVYPTTVAEAVSALAEHGDTARPLAGGTALSVLMKQRLVSPDVLVSLDRIPELVGITVDGETLRIGAMTSQRTVERSEIVQGLVPVLAEAYKRVATVRLRNQATVGGGLAHADPAQDPPATLLVLDARVVLAGPKGERELPLTKFFRDYYETALRDGEILKEVIIPLPKPGSGAAYLPFLPRTVEDYATIGVAASVRLENGLLTDVRVAFIGAATTALRGEAIEEALEGQPVSAIAEAAKLALDIVDPMDDLRGSSDYKREMAVVFAKRALEAAAKRAGGA